MDRRVPVKELQKAQRFSAEHWNTMAKVAGALEIRPGAALALIKAVTGRAPSEGNRRMFHFMWQITSKSRLFRDEMKRGMVVVETPDGKVTAHQVGERVSGDLSGSDDKGTDND